MTERVAPSSPAERRIFSTERLEVRVFSTADLPAFLAYRRDPEVARYQSWSPDYPDVDARAFIDAVTRAAFGARGEWVNLAVALAAGGQLVGDVALRVEPDGSSGQIGFTLSRAHQGHGYAREAVGALCEHAHRELGLAQLFAITDARNARSIALLGALGFVAGEPHRRKVWFKGEICDELRFVRAR